MRKSQIDLSISDSNDFSFQDSGNLVEILRAARHLDISSCCCVERDFSYSSNSHISSSLVGLIGVSRSESYSFSFILPGNISILFLRVHRYPPRGISCGCLSDFDHPSHILSSLSAGTQESNESKDGTADIGCPTLNASIVPPFIESFHILWTMTVLFH